MMRKYLLLISPLTVITGLLLRHVFAYELTLDKDNLINVIFVKNGWFWTTLVTFWFVIRYKYQDPTYLKKALYRYIVVTIWWYTFTQGIPFTNLPPLMDSVFLFTGGSCEFNIIDERQGIVNAHFQDNSTRRVRSMKLLLDKLGSLNMNQQDSVLLTTISKIFKQQFNVTNVTGLNKFIANKINTIAIMNSSQRCRTHGGYWYGGHDPSGHTFLLSLMITYLTNELLLSKIKMNISYIVHDLLTVLDNGALWNLLQENNNSIFYNVIIKPPLHFYHSLLKITRRTILHHPIRIIIAMILLCLFILLQTTLTEFHTTNELLSGLIASLLIMIPLVNIM